MTTRNDGGLSQAIAQFHSIVEMVSALRFAEKAGNDRAENEARERINEDALSVEVRSGWYSPGNKEDSSPAEYTILLCTGGPAVRIRGELSDYCEPESAFIEYQDWFTGWTRWTPGNSQNVESILLAYSAVFYFGE
ncbi:hypothetical protein [Bradyrhizobium retamae]|uniref:Uncharacterized protein n=1 Tax=Bradyrhizobium retamae TaxID=1300035 RepID=A0A0R3MQ38_9BRAD|nr:hypothetical protein [Bradyrhizobium retamae]KRR21694.1 hypothetical protein CQ13_06485 [Bradyrhizobium retamae]